MSEPLGVSVIIVNYNNACFLGSAIDNALGQNSSILRSNRCRRLLDGQLASGNRALRRLDKICASRDKRRSDGGIE